MTEPDPAWQLQWISTLADHVAVAVDPLLPEGCDVAASANRINVMRRAPGGPLRTVTSHDLPLPSAESVFGEWTVAYALHDLQDEIIRHLGAAWPERDGTSGFHGRARQADGHIDLWFENAAGDTIELPPFVPPPSPGRTRTAG